MTDPKAYYFLEPEATETVCNLLKITAKNTDSNLELKLERTLRCDKDKDYTTDSLSGIFHKEGRSISFTVPLARDGENYFDGIEFSPFELQEFNEYDELGNYVDSLTKKLDDNYKMHLNVKYKGRKTGFNKNLAKDANSPCDQV